MGKLDALMKEMSIKIFKAGGIDGPLVKKRRARMCVGVRARYKYVVPDGVVLDASSSGATYFMERRWKAEMVNLLDKIVQVDLAFARASYAQWMNGVRPIFSSKDDKCLDYGADEIAISVDIEGIQHPLLLESSFRNMKIGYGTQVVVISGPYTGGKTASMKTLGLASLMSKAGMYLPAKNQPKFPWFVLVLADIGDQQVWQSRTAESKDGEVSYSPAVQRSKNTVDLRGMRAEEASYNLDMAVGA
ncbi:hypothetical protein ACLB2K_073830 [Fragaria x ananassa]